MIIGDEYNRIDSMIPHFQERCGVELVVRYRIKWYGVARYDMVRNYTLQYDTL